MVENNEEIANIYQDLYPNDNVIIGDAHKYLIENYHKFEFIWSSPPCPSHSRFRFMTTKMKNEKYKRPVIYPDMNLYQEIILLQNYFTGNWVVENVKGYYKPLITPQESGRHYFWSNFSIGNFKTDNDNFIKKSTSELSELAHVDLSKYKIKHRKDQIIRNCVNPYLGEYIMNCARNYQPPIHE